MSEQKTVSYYLVAKKIIKFADSATKFPVTAEEVPVSLAKGDNVNVVITDGAVTFVEKVTAKAVTAQENDEQYEPTAEEEVKPIPPVKKEAPEPAKIPATPTATPTSEPSQMQELTVFAVSGDKRVVKFLEIKDLGWFDVAENIKSLDYKEIGMIAKSKIKVQFADKTIVAYEKVAQVAQKQAVEASVAPKTETVSTSAVTPQSTPVAAPKKEWVPYKSQDNDARQTSIEAQASLNSACNIVGRVAASISPAPTASVINNMVKAVAEANYVLIQELKKK